MARILVVDNDPPYREMVETMLLRQGHSVLAAENGRQCLDRLDQQAVDLVITDFFIPVQDVVETIVAIRGQGYAIPIIGMTDGLAGSAMMRLCTDAMLVKPFSATELSAAINASLAGQPDKGSVVP